MKWAQSSRTASSTLTLAQELLPDFTDLLMNPFASHVCRALLALLVPNIFPTEQRASVLRSKKSAAYKARQGTMKSLFNEKAEASKAVPPKFTLLAEQLMKSVGSKLSANEVRALAASSVACPVLKVNNPGDLWNHAHICSTDAFGNRGGLQSF